jgi:hypothetical protein
VARPQGLYLRQRRRNPHTDEVVTLFFAPSRRNPSGHEPWRNLMSDGGSAKSLRHAGGAMLGWRGLLRDDHANAYE